MKIFLQFKLLLVFILLYSSLLTAQNYPDQNYVCRIDSIYFNIESSSGVRLSSDGRSMELEDGVKDGYIILKPAYSEEPFNQGLPSWNGSAPGTNSSFKVQMRFPYSSGWSPWLTVGFWKANIWGNYGSTSYAEGYIDYDYVKLNVYQNSWQFKVIMTRYSADQPSPTLNKLSFFVSDSRTTSSVNISQIVADYPEEFFIPTQFVYQYGVDPTIGGSICSPASVSMILKSYGITVDTYQFALDTYDPYYKMFGIWPRVVQNASEFGLDGAVTRYRTWSETREVLANGGRIAMSVGQPLYAGHLIMLAGFTSTGNPIVHDPAKSNGYSYVFNKTDLSRSWFSKGGVAYTFYPADSSHVITGAKEDKLNQIADNYRLHQNFPNPFNPSTTISFTLPMPGFVNLVVMDILGQEVASLINEERTAGYHQVNFNAGSLTSGIYLYKIQSGSYTQIRKMILVK
jgi:hypothetical protein